MGDKKGRLVLGLIVFGTFLLMISFTSAFAVGSEYWKNNTLVVNPGETVDFFVVLQNIAGAGGDVNVEGSLIKGGKFASFVGDTQEYFVPFGEKKKVYLTVSVPENATIDEITDIVVSFKIIAGEGSEALGLGSSIERVIPVEVIKKVVVESEEKVSSSVLMWLLLGAVVALMIWFYKKRSN